MPSRAALLLPPLLLAPVLVACTDATGCTDTTVVAQEANKIDVTGVLSSSVLTARLTRTDSGKALAGSTLTFTLRAGGSDVYRADTSTRSDGSASFDVKARVSASALIGLARSDSFTASYAGSATFCSSADDAKLRNVTIGG